MQRFLIAIVILVALGLAVFYAGKVQLTGRGSGVAGRFDSLKCYKVSERARAFRATADVSLSLGRSGVALSEDCRITGKVVRFCTPVSVGIESTDAVLVDVSAQELSDDFTCYKIKCLADEHSAPRLTDKFGIKLLSKYKVREVCIAAS